MPALENVASLAVSSLFVGGFHTCLHFMADAATLRYRPRKKQMLELTTHPAQMDTHTSPADIKAALEAAQSGKNVTSCIAGWWCSTWSVGNICSSSKWESKKCIKKGALCFGCARQGREEPFLRAAQAMLVPGLVGKIPQSCQTKCLGSGPSEDRWYSDATRLRPFAPGTHDSLAGVLQRQSPYCT